MWNVCGRESGEVATAVVLGGVVTGGGGYRVAIAHRA